MAGKAKGFSDRRKACHMCGNIRKTNVVTCRGCPHVFCHNCVDKALAAWGEQSFTNNGCPVCQGFCCCADKSLACMHSHHCYRKCPTQKNLKLAVDAMELAHEAMSIAVGADCIPSYINTVPSVPLLRRNPHYQPPQRSISPLPTFSEPLENFDNIHKCTCAYGRQLVASGALADLSQTTGCSQTQSLGKAVRSPQETDGFYWDAEMKLAVEDLRFSADDVGSPHSLMVLQSHHSCQDLWEHVLEDEESKMESSSSGATGTAMHTEETRALSP